MGTRSMPVTAADIIDAQKKVTDLLVVNPPADDKLMLTTACCCTMCSIFAEWPACCSVNTNAECFICSGDVGVSCLTCLGEDKQATKAWETCIGVPMLRHDRGRLHLLRGRGRHDRLLLHAWCHARLVWLQQHQIVPHRRTGTVHRLSLPDSSRR